MARHERGIYEPSEEVRVFDGAEEEDDAEGSRLPLLIVLALVVLCAFAGVVWLAYTQGVARGRTETPVLAAAPGPERVAPQNAGGSTVPYQGFKIYEQPAPADDEADAPLTTAPEQAAPPKAEAPKPAPKPAPQEAAAKPEPAPRVAAAPPPAPKLAPAPKPEPAAAKPAAPPPAAKPASPPPAAASSMATGAPRALPGITAAPPAPRPVAATPAPAAGGATVLQIGAYKSQADADAAWRAYKAKHAALLSGFGSDVQKVDLGDKGIWYRLRIAGFADRNGAEATCDRLKADGGSCFLGK
jgi:outer membrane biosynthesis protein TonB